MRAKGLLFNQLDNSRDTVVNRVSYTGKYDIFDALPRYHARILIL